MSEMSGTEGASKADQYGYGSYPAIIREPLVAVRMLANAGVAATLEHVSTISLLRVHDRLFDRSRRAKFQTSLENATNADAQRVRTTTPEEIVEAVHCAPLPSKTIQWAIEAAGIEPAEFHLVDVGSGWGFALEVAAQLPFRGLTGIEFDGEFHKMAVRNFDAFIADGTVEPGRVTLKHESALEAELPVDPLVVLLANPFGEQIMARFLDRLAESVAEHPRPVIIIYVNPTQAHLFQRPGLEEMVLSGPSALLLKLFSPYRVEAYRWKS
ncbi:MAG: hypothetical protein AAF967_03510 [Pseudomonadota bacterium]